MHKYDPTNLFLETYNYDVWFKNEESTDKARKGDKVPPMPSLEGYEKGKGLKILTWNKLLTTLITISLVQTKVGNNSNK